MRSRVDFPEPDRPSRPTISRSRSARLTLSMTTRSAPDGRGKAWRTLRTSTRAGPAAMTSASFASVEPEAPLRHPVERAPEQPVEQDDISGHHGNAQDDMREVARVRGGRDIGAEPMGREMRLPPAHRLGHDAGVPAAAGGGDGAGDVIGED